MYIKDDIAYAENPKPILKATWVKPQDNYKLLVCFSNGEKKLFDMQPYLDKGVFAALKDKNAFSGVYIERGVLTWEDGDIDIDTYYVYEHGTNIANVAN